MITAEQLYDAAEAGDSKVVKKFLGQKDVPDLSEQMGVALCLSASRGHGETAELLLDHGADVNFYNCLSRDVHSPLSCAAVAGHLELMAMLLDRGADVNNKNFNGQNTVEAAAQMGHLKVLTLLLDRGASIDAEVLKAAAESGSLERVSLLLDRGAEINGRSFSGDTAIMTAAMNGHLEAVALLLNRSAIIDANTLIAAAKGGSLKTVKLLLDRGVNVNAQGMNTSNALQTAVSYMDIQPRPESAAIYAMVDFLLCRGADPTIQPIVYDRRSLLHHAIEHTDLAVVRRLWDAGADIHQDTQDTSGLTPLHAAVNKGDARIVEFLVEQGASPNTTDNFEQSPLESAILMRSVEIVDLLLPTARIGLSSISASDWRSHFDPTHQFDLMISDHLPIARLDPRDLPEEFDIIRGMSLPYVIIIDHTRKFIILRDAGRLSPQARFNNHSYWWCECRNKDFRYAIKARSVPSHLAIQRERSHICFLECALHLTCYALPDNLQEWPDAAKIDERSFQRLESRQAVVWLMVKPSDRNSDSTLLVSLTFCSTSEYAVMPRVATDLFLPFLHKIRNMWNHTFRMFQQRHSSMRADILRSSGNDPALVRCLLSDAQLLELLKDSFAKQTETLSLFHDWYLNKSSSPIYEEPLDQVTEKMAEFHHESENLRTLIDKQLRTISESSKDLIQLEFNLTSINEAQKSTSTNRSLKRLSWITFIFLPALFIASLFGMNVDILKNNPAWWWYLPFAVGTSLITLFVWITFKRSNSLEGQLERRFQWLIGQPKNQDQDLEKGGVDQSGETQAAETARFPATGKKRS